MYADYQALMAQTEEYLQIMLERIGGAGQDHGMRLRKSKAMKIGKEEVQLM